MEHYMCHKSYIPKTRAERISDTVEFSPKTFHIPQMFSMDATYNTAQDIIYALHNPEPASPLVELWHVHKEVFKTLTDIYSEKQTPQQYLRG